MIAPIRVIVVDDHGLVRRGIRALLKEEPDIQVVGEACDGATAIDVARQLRPDVLLMDLVMPRMDGFEAIRQIRSTVPEARILVLTSFATDEQIFPAIRAGANGYLLKDSEPDDLVVAIRQAYRGEITLHPNIARKVWQEVTHAREVTSRSAALSDRETTVLQLAARGWSNQQIANDLHISQATVRTHVSNILSKLHVASRTQAVVYALREGLVTLTDPEQHA